MLDSIRRFFDRSMSTGEHPADTDTGEPDLALAACALLLELAHADEEFTADERDHLESAMRRHFDLDPEEADHLIELAEAERSQAVDIWQFTSLINRSYSLDQKMVLAETMWGLVFSDGELADREQYLVRKISHLLNIRAGYLSEARDRVRAREELE